MRPRRRRAPKQARIVEALRQRILEGALKPGDRLPPRSDFEREFRTTSITVQRAFDRLIGDGFVTAVDRRGSFVSRRPPHLNRYALAFPLEAGDEGWVRFWTVLTNVARSMELSTGVSLPVYTGIAAHADSDGYRALEDDVLARRLAGIIFASNPFMAGGSPILDEPGLPRVAFMRGPVPAGLSAVNVEMSQFLARAAERLAERNRRRVALIGVPGMADETLAGLVADLKRRGMATDARLLQAGHQSDPRWAEHLALLLVGGEGPERPDALIVADDNLSERACAGVLRAGGRIGDDIDVIVHCNFPAPAATALPVLRLGYDVQGMIETAVGIISQQRRGRTPRRVTVVPPQFEEEVARARGPGAVVRDTHVEETSPRPRGR